MPGQIQKYLLVIAALMLVGIVLAGLVIAGATRSWHAVIKAGNETATIQNLQTVAAVEAAYFYGHNRRFATFEELTSEQLLNSKFSGSPVTVDGYVFTLKVTTDPAAYTLAADPERQATGTKHFYVDSVSWRIHVNSHQPAGPGDPLLSEK